MMSKLRPHHRQRHADVYRRQSTPGQVDSQRDRTARQYALADRAVDLGWARGQVVRLDQALGKSGPTTPGRDDFHRLMAAVGLGEVGAGCALEASRFSRAHADGHRLLDLCALTDTLVVDHDGVYAPNDFNDRGLLGFKGTWRHTALHALRLRRQGANLPKAHTGELRGNPPTGYISDPAGALVLDPDESVVASIHLVFQQFKTLGSADGVLRFFAHQQLPLPRHQRSPALGAAQPQPPAGPPAQPHLYGCLCLWPAAQPPGGGGGAGRPDPSSATSPSAVDGGHPGRSPRLSQLGGLSGEPPAADPHPY
jgi:DNA invertase Pin-like site-specific DNA recombinase